ncbi:hypothetical protein JCM3765_003495 [Sporobolomyces pararoseus]
MSSGPTQYWWNDTAIEYNCDERTPEDEQWKEFELVSEGSRMKMASAPYCNATATYRGGSFVSINGALSPNGSTWGCSVDGKQWVWYSAKGNGESWKGQVLCAWDQMSSDQDIRTWLSTDPSGETAVALGSWIGLPSETTAEGKTSTMDFFPTISQPAPFDLDAATSSSSSESTTSTGDKATKTDGSSGGSATSTGNTSLETGKSSEATAKAGATTSASQSGGTNVAATLTGSPNSSDSSSSSSESTNSPTVTYIVVGVGTFVLVGGLLAFILCLKGRGKKKKGGDDSSEDDSLLSSDEGSDSGSDSDDRHPKKKGKKRR